MPWNGSGTFVPSGADFPAVAGTIILSSKFNNLINDIAAGISICLTKDGQVIAVANQNMGGFKHTNAAAASAPAEYVILGQMQNSDAMLVGSVAGTNTITGSLTPAITAYLTGQLFSFIPAVTNTGATTINLNGLGAKTIFANGVALVGGELIAGVPVLLFYDGTRFNAIDANPSAVVVSSLNVGSRVLGCDCKNNAGTPATQFDLNAAEVLLRNTAGNSVVRIAPGVITNNILTAGPAVNGRDQAGAFVAGWIHFYWIWNGTTLGTISSIVAPPTGPTLPATYTHWGYAGAVRYGGASLLLGYIKGSTFHYTQFVTAIASGSATVSTAVSVSTIIPPNALSYTITPFSTILVADGSGNASYSVGIGVVSGALRWFPVNQQLAGLSPFSAMAFPFAGPMEVPNVAQQFFYVHSIGAGSGPQFTATVNSYKIPNGGE